MRGERTKRFFVLVVAISKQIDDEAGGHSSDGRSHGTTDSGIVADKLGVYELDIVLQGQIVRPDALQYAPTLCKFCTCQNGQNSAPVDVLTEKINKSCRSIGLEVDATSLGVF